MINRLVIPKLWVNGRVVEDGDEWTEEVRGYYDRFYEDKDETSEVKAERIRGQRRSVHRRVVLQERQLMITVDKVLRAPGKMFRNNATGPADCLFDRKVATSPDGSCVRGIGSTSVSEESVVPRRLGKYYVSCSSEKKLTPNLRFCVDSVRSHC